VAAALIGLSVRHVLYWLARRLAIHQGAGQQQILLSHVAQPLGSVLPLLIVLAVLPGLPLSPSIAEPTHHLFLLCLVSALAWLVVGIIGYMEQLVTRSYDLDVEDNWQARRVRTQVQLFRKIAVACVLLGAFAVMLMTFPAIWSLGASVLASAGVAGLVVGMAARPALSNLIAGVQIALTEPIRIDDVVIVEGEWGRIEEVNTTYVVIRTWDLRRLIVPLTYFMEKPFQNWTRTSTDLIGTVFIYADYTVPVEHLRAELQRLVEANTLWNRKTCVLQVTDAKEHAMELRALVSAGNASALWDLRCGIREGLVQFLQERHPNHLPRTRAEVWSGTVLAGRSAETGFHARNVSEVTGTRS
jgi:small-conductance mechanosensitive channel